MFLELAKKLFSLTNDSHSRKKKEKTIKTTTLKTNKLCWKKKILTYYTLPWVLRRTTL